MLSLEVVGPGGSLSTALIATPYRRDASWRESWQAATAMAATSCDRTATAALIHRLGSGWRRHWRSGLASTAMDQIISNSARFCIYNYSAFFIVNSARLSLFGNLFGLFHMFLVEVVIVGQ